MNYYQSFQIMFLMLIFFAGSKIAIARQFGPADTSFTFNSAYISIKRAYPDATIPKLNLRDSVRSFYNITYSYEDNRDLKLDIFSPKQNEQKLPAVMMIFGGGWRSGNRTMHYQMAQALAAKGYIIVTPDYRLSTEALYPAAVLDLKTALKWIGANAKRYHIDQGKIAVWGFSAGGQLASLIGSTGGNPVFKTPHYKGYSDKVQAIIDVDGILAFIHPESGEGDDSKHTSSATYWFGFSKTARPDLWQQASALNHVDKNTPPFLFLNSGVERMHAGRNDMIAKLDSLHIYDEVHTFAGAPHTFILFEPWFTPSLSYTVAFLDKVFKGK